MRLWLIGLAVLLFGFLMAGPPQPALAFDFFGNNPTSPCDSQTKDSPVCQPSTDNENPVVKTIRIATTVLALIGGFLAVLMIIISGFQFVTSAGKDESVANARKRITNSIIGLIIIALAWTIVTFVIDRIVG